MGVDLLPGIRKKAARKEEWEKLLSGYFKKGNAIAALNEQAKAVKERIGESKAGKRKVVLVIPEPIPNQTDWGEINGKKSSFHGPKRSFVCVQVVH